MIAKSEGILTLWLCVAGVPILVGLVVQHVKGRPLLPVHPAPFARVEPSVPLGLALLLFAAYFIAQIIIVRGQPIAVVGGLAFALVVARRTHRFLQRQLFRPQGGAGRRLQQALVLTWAALPVVYGIALLVAALGGRTVQPTVEQIANRESGWVALALMAVLVAPLMEEMVFRGLLYPGLRQLWGPRAAIIVSACLFGLIHPPGVWAPMTVYGIFLAYLVESTGSVWPCIVSHVLFNGLTVAQLIFG